MIFGIGVDLIEIDRIKKIVDKNPRFLERNFTPWEVAYFQTKASPYETIAGNYAAKEAVAKAFGTGIRGFNLIDLSIERNELGMPIVVCYNGARELYERLNIKKLHISISHSDFYATAYVIAEN